MDFEILTAAPNGVLTSQYFGDAFQLKKLEKKFNYHFRIFIPVTIMEDPNVTLHVKLDQIPGFIDSIKDDEYNKIKFDSNNTLAYTPIEYDGYSFIIERNIEDNDLETTNLLSMPGFQLSWYISGAEVTPEKVYDPLGRTRKFIRF